MWHRLTHADQFASVLALRPVALTPHFAWHAVTGGSVNAIGLVVPKRWARRAVTRNLIRRQIYAVTAQSALACPTALHVVRLRAGFDRSVYHSCASDALRAAVRAELQTLFQAAVRRLGASPCSSSSSAV